MSIDPRIPATSPARDKAEITAETQRAYLFTSPGVYAWEPNYFFSPGVNAWASERAHDQCVYAVVALSQLVAAMSR